MSGLEPGARASAAVLVLALFTASGAILPLISGVNASTEETGSSLSRVALVGAALAGLFIELNRPLRGPARRASGLMVLAAPVLASLLWSAYPSVSERKILNLLIIGSLAVQAARRLSLERILTVVSATVAALTVIGMAASAVGGSQFLDEDYASGGTAWRGVFVTKNDFGRLCALSVLLALIQIARGSNRRRWGLLLVVSVVGLWEAQAKTGLAVLAATAAVVVIVDGLRRDGRARLLRAITGVVALGSIIYGVLNLASLIPSLGRSADLTGRRQIWDSVDQVGAAHSTLGVGWGAFWQGSKGPSLAVWQTLDFHPPNAHNAFLDIWLQLGSVGEAIFVGFLALVSMRAINLVRRSSSSLSWFPVTIIAFTIFYDYTESTSVHPMFVLLTGICAVVVAPLRTPATKPAATTMRRV